MQQREGDLDLAIIGAGAAGLMAAIFAGRSARESGSAIRIAALDGAARIGAKILISGGGRCNVTHHAVAAEDFHGNRNLIRRVLRSFDVRQTVELFEHLGVSLKREETGKLFPVDDRAATVLDALLCEVGANGVDLRSGWRIESVVRTEDDRFLLRCGRGDIRARRLVLASGGRSVPKTGSDGVGYDIARSLGHTIHSPFPALVPLLLQGDHWLTALRGVSAMVELRVRTREGRIVERRRGSMLCTHFGISGPVVLDISRSWIAARTEGTDPFLEVSFCPEESRRSMDLRWLTAANRRPRASIGTIMAEIVPTRLAEGLMRAADVEPATMLARMSKTDRARLNTALLELPLEIRDSRGFDYAEVTAGGVPLEEIHSGTMQSRRCPGLFLCGEILDVDGRIGGFNFQWAWASGRLAGMHAVPPTG